MYGIFGGDIKKSSYPEPRFLCLDSLIGQKKRPVIHELNKLDVVASVVPEGCSNFVEPLNVAIAHPFKTRIAELAETYYDNLSTKHVTGKHRFRDRRFLLIQWVGQAWNELHGDPAFIRLIRHTFRELGFSLNPNGSEDGELRIKNLPDLEIGDWRSGE